MKVYLLETGLYESTCIRGIFATPEQAMATWHPKERVYSRDDRVFRFEWVLNPVSGWIFDADWDEAAQIIEFEVQGTSQDLTDEFRVQE